jgi:extracellular factor (EF) 3-hydroxypalmitic acid methyl ester biosynthesis protein
MPLRHDGSGGTRSARPSTSTPAERISHYTELEGASGRDILFRPERYPRAELGPIGAAVSVLHGGIHQRCELFDISLNGIAFEWPAPPAPAPPEQGALLEEVSICFDEHDAYRGRARVCWRRQEGSALLVGASLIDAAMNIDDVLQLRDVKARMAASDYPRLRLESGIWRVSGQDRFKALVAELRLFLEDARQQLGELEASLAPHVLHGATSTPARDMLIRTLEQGFVADLVRASNDLDAALRGASPEARGGLREFSERYLGELLMQSPWMHRARHKPLGYPGDFEVMNGLYRRDFAGPTLFAKALNLGFVSTPAAEAVRSRKALIQSRLSALLDDKERRAEACRVLSVAAGPAEEVFGLLEERRHLGVPLEVVLFDQDKSALAFSFARLARSVAARWQGKVRVQHLHDSIIRLLRGSTALSAWGAFDAVYACGLFDYLQPHTWVALCRSLYAQVAPGGTLYVGNMVPSSPSRWFMELHLDWPLEYREHEELVALARRAAPDAEIKVIEEATGVNPFVALTRA